MPSAQSYDNLGKNRTFLGCNISSFSDTAQFAILFGSLLFFMCLYGLFQEIVVYEWFDRKLSVFMAALHFLGCVICAIFLHIISADSIVEGVRSLGHAPKAPLWLYLGLCSLKAATQLFTNLSMQHINFPTKILLKACLPVVTMVLGFGIQGIRYPNAEIFSVLVLTIGLAVFLLGDDMALPQGTALGFFFVFLSLLSSALTPMLQEHLAMRYGASTSEMLLNIYIGSFLISFALTYIFDEMDDGINVLRTTSTPFYLVSLVCFSTFAFMGTSSSIGITIRYGALTNGICNSCRKVLSVIISILSFPERNGISAVQLFGTTLFAGGLFLKAKSSKKNNNRDSSGKLVVLSAGEDAPHVAFVGKKNIRGTDPISPYSRPAVTHSSA